MSFAITWSNEDVARIASVGGRVDSSNSHDFHAALQQGSKADTWALVLDFADLSYISSAGLRVVLQMAKAFTSPKTLIICGLNPFLAEIFTICGFNQILAIQKNKAAALSILTGG